MRSQWLPLVVALLASSLPTVMTAQPAAPFGPITYWEYEGCADTWICGIVTVTKQQKPLTDDALGLTDTFVTAHLTPTVLGRTDLVLLHSLSFIGNGPRPFREGFFTTFGEITGPISIGRGFTYPFETWTPLPRIMFVATRLDPSEFTGSRGRLMEPTLLRTYTVVPEPAAFALVSLGGLLLLIGWRCRRVVER